MPVSSIYNCLHVYKVILENNGYYHWLFKFKIWKYEGHFHCSKYDYSTLFLALKVFIGRVKAFDLWSLWAPLKTKSLLEVKYYLFILFHYFATVYIRIIYNLCKKLTFKNHLISFSILRGETCLCMWVHYFYKTQI